MSVEALRTLTETKIDECSMTVTTFVKGRCVDGMTTDRDGRTTDRIFIAIDLHSVGQAEVTVLNDSSVITFWPRSSNLISRVIKGPKAVQYEYVYFACDGSSLRDEETYSVSVVLSETIDANFGQKLTAYVRNYCR